MGHVFGAPQPVSAALQRNPLSRSSALLEEPLDVLGHQPPLLRAPVVAANLDRSTLLFANAIPRRHLVFLQALG